MALTKTIITEQIQTRLDLPRNTAYEVMEEFLEIIKSTIESGEDIMISGFGKFCVKDKRQRRGRNPATGDSMLLSPRRIVTFKCSGKLREKLDLAE